MEERSVDLRDRVTVWVPSTIANLNVGFDALGLALESPQERMELKRFQRVAGAPRVVIKLEPNSSLPSDPLRNVAGVAARSVLERGEADFGVEIEVFKPVRPGSGLGSSAASAVAAAVGVSALLPTPLPREQLLECALDGEELASGSRHLDNVAPAMFGGLCLSLSGERSIPLPVPTWWIVILRPLVTVRTADARAALPDHVSLSRASESAAWMGRFVDACHRGDHRAAARSLRDLYVGPARAHLIPGFELCRDAALSAGAINGGISGSGPSTFWICLDQESALSVEARLKEVMRGCGCEYRTFVTQPSLQGAHSDLSKT